MVIWFGLRSHPWGRHSKYVLYNSMCKLGIRDNETGSVVMRTLLESCNSLSFIQFPSCSGTSFNLFLCRRKISRLPSAPTVSGTTLMSLSWACLLIFKVSTRFTDLSQVYLARILTTLKGFRVPRSCLGVALVYSRKQTTFAAP